MVMSFHLANSWSISGGIHGTSDELYRTMLQGTGETPAPYALFTHAGLLRAWDGAVTFLRKG